MAERKTPRSAWLAGMLALPGLAGAAIPGAPARHDRAPAAGPEHHRIRIVNRLFGAVQVSHDQGRTWRLVGRVLRPDPGKLHAIGDREFTAADWAPLGAVAATAVNALHLKADQGEAHAAVFSVLPAELAVSGPTGSYRDAEASILTDIPAGTGIFGAEAAPRVGDAVWRERFPGGELEPWPAGRAPAVGDRVVLLCRAPASPPGVIEIENSWGGLVRQRVGATWRVLARVYRPLGGSGRFGGTAYQEPGRVRANHPGVLCVSTSPRGETGGFQIVPAFHANEVTLTYVKSTTAYLVVGPANLDDEPLEGHAPLFLGSFRPGDLVEARIGGVWMALPEVAGKKASALEPVEALRLHPSP